MTILERLATTKAHLVVDLIERHKASTQTDASSGQAVAWDNNPAWDNWKQKTPTFKKKRVYFKQK